MTGVLVVFRAVLICVGPSPSRFRASVRHGAGCLSFVQECERYVLGGSDLDYPPCPQHSRAEAVSLETASIYLWAHTILLVLGYPTLLLWNSKLKVGQSTNSSAAPDVGCRCLGWLITFPLPSPPPSVLSTVLLRCCGSIVLYAEPVKPATKGCFLAEDASYPSATLRIGVGLHMGFYRRVPRKVIVDDPSLFGVCSSSYSSNHPGDPREQNSRSVLYESSADPSEQVGTIDTSCQLSQKTFEPVLRRNLLQGPLHLVYLLRTQD